MKCNDVHVRLFNWKRVERGSGAKTSILCADLKIKTVIVIAVYTYNVATYLIYKK